jgi:putative restriction endonuclease
MQYWLFRIFEERKQYVGNLGYDDDIKSRYQYDNRVQNHKRVAIGDIAFVEKDYTVKGLARILDIHEYQDEKVSRKCPECKKNGESKGIKERSTLTPKYKCSQGHEFDEPYEEWVPVRKFDALFGKSFRNIEGLIHLDALREAAIRLNKQLSIQGLDPAYFGKHHPDIETLLNEILKNHEISTSLKSQAKLRLKD